MDSLLLVDSWDQDNAIIKKFIGSLPKKDAPIDILEAGCGNQWDLDLSGLSYLLTGIDRDKDALEIRKNVSKDLDKIIVGDLCNAELDACAFDVIYNSFVLEHVVNADVVLQNFVKWLRPGGLMVIRIPDPMSVQGFITKLTPHWFHVFYYKYVLRDPHAGLPGYAPYPTCYHPVVSRRGLAAFCAQNGLSIVNESGESYHNPGNGVVKGLIKAVKVAVSLMSLGKLSHKHTNLLYIIRKNG